MNFRKCWSSKPKEKLKRKTECPGQKRNETDKEQDCQEGSHVDGHFLATWSLLDSPIWVHLTWPPQVGKRSTSWSTSTSASCVERSNVKVGARPTVVRNRVHATACWYAGLLGACRRYNGRRRARAPPMANRHVLVAIGNASRLRSDYHSNQAANVDICPSCESPTCITYGTGLNLKFSDVSAGLEYGSVSEYDTVKPRK